MSIIGPLLVGHDGSPEADMASAWTAELARVLGERLIVGRAFLVGESPGGPESGAALAATQLSELVASADGWGLASNLISTSVHSGKAGPALVGMVRGEGAGLLAVGNRRRPYSDAALGRVAQHVTFRSPCPVAVIRQVGGPIASAPLVVGVDADNPNLEPVMWAMTLAKGLSATLHVVSVGDERAATEPIAELVRLLENDGGPTMRFDRLIGKPAEELLLIADRLDCSAVVIGQRRRHNLGGRLLGQVTASVLRGNDRPTIVSSHD